MQAGRRKACELPRGSRAASELASAAGAKQGMEI